MFTLQRYKIKKWLLLPNFVFRKQEHTMHIMEMHLVILEINGTKIPSEGEIMRKMKYVLDYIPNFLTIDAST